MVKRDKIRRRLSWVGWAFVVISIATALAAVRAQAAMLFVLFGGMLGALLVNWRMARSMVARLRVRRDVADRVWQGQTVHVGYFLRNPKPGQSALGLTIDEVFDVRQRKEASQSAVSVDLGASEGIQSAAGYCVVLPAGRAFRAGGRFVCHRRGRIALGRCRVRSSFPFGFVTAWRTFRQSATVIVWPARGTLRRQLLHRGAVETSRAVASVVSGGQDEFFGLREYRGEDNPRWIHWRKSASRTAPVVREMARPQPETLWVVLDTYYGAGVSPAQTPAETEDAPLRPVERGRDARATMQAYIETQLSFAATLIDHAFVRGYQVGLALGGERCVVLPPGGALAKRTSLLDALAEAADNPARRLTDVLAAVPRGAMQNAQVVVVTPAPAQSADALSRLRGLCRHVSVVDRETMAEIFTPAAPFTGEAADAR